MKRTLSLATAAALLCGSTVVADSCPSKSAQHQTTQQVAAEAKNIVETAAAAGSFETLIAAAKAAGLAEALTSSGPLTVFAPTDDAFAKLPEGTIDTLLKPENKEQLQAILLYHVVPGNLPASKVVKLSAAQSKQGEMIPFKVEGDKVMVGGANVVKTDIQCSNGIVHVIDSVILPPSTKEQKDASTTATKTSPVAAEAKPKDIVDTAAGADSFKTLVAAVKAAGLVETLKGEGPFTVFAPTDEAFAMLPKGTLESLLKPENKEKLVAILTYHVVPGKVLAEDVVGLKKATTVNGKDVKITVADGKVKINDANVTKTDIDCSNGVIHVIDAVILP